MDGTAKDDFSKALYIVHHNWDSVNCFVDKYNDWATKCESFLNFLANNRRKPLDECLLPSPLSSVTATVMVTLCLLESIRCNDVFYLSVGSVFLGLLLLMSLMTSIVIVFVTRFDRPSKKSINFVMEINEALIEESEKLNNFRKICGLDSRAGVLHYIMLSNDPYVSVYSSFTDLLLKMLLSWYHFLGVLLGVMISFQFSFFQIDVPFDILSFASLCLAVLLASVLDTKISSCRKKIDCSALKFLVNEIFEWFQKCRLKSLLEHLHPLSNDMDFQKKSNRTDKVEGYLKHIAIVVEATHEIRCKLNYVDVIERFTFHPNEDCEYFAKGIEDISAEKNTLHVDIKAIRTLVDDLLEFTAGINSPTNSLYFNDSTMLSQNSSSNSVTEKKIINYESVSGERGKDLKEERSSSSLENSEKSLYVNETIDLKENTYSSQNGSSKSVTELTAVNNNSASDERTGDLKEETGSSFPRNSKVCLESNEIINSRSDICNSQNDSSKSVTESTTINKKLASDERTGDLKEETGSSFPRNSEFCLDGKKIMYPKDDTCTSQNGSAISVTESTTLDNKSTLDEGTGDLKEETGSSFSRNSEVCLDGNEIINSKSDTCTSQNDSSKSVTESTTLDNKSTLNERTGDLKEETGSSFPRNSEVCLDGNEIINSRSDTCTSQNDSSKSATESTTINKKSASDEKTGDLKEEAGSSFPRNSEVCLDGNEIINSKSDKCTSQNDSSKSVTESTTLDNKSASDEKTREIKQETDSSSKDNFKHCLDGKEIINSKDDTCTSQNNSSKSVTEREIDYRRIKLKESSKRKLEDSSNASDTSFILDNAQTETLSKNENPIEDSEESGNTNSNVNFKVENGPVSTTGLSGQLGGGLIFEFVKSSSYNLGDNHEGFGSASVAKSTPKLKNKKGKEKRSLQRNFDSVHSKTENGKNFNPVLGTSPLFTKPQKVEENLTHEWVTDDSKPILPLFSANNHFTLNSKTPFPSVQPTVIPNEETKNETLVINEHFSGLEKENEQAHPTPQKTQSASISIEADEFTPEFLVNKNKTHLIDSSTAISNADPSLEANTDNTDRPIEDISICTSQPSLDSKSKEKSKSIQNILHAGEENQNVKNKHKNECIRSSENGDFDLKDMYRTHKSYDSLCSTFKTKDSSVFAKNVSKENSECIQGEAHAISNLQKISNGIKTFVVQSSTSMVCISEPEHYTSSVLFDVSCELRHFSSNEEKTLPDRENLFQHLPIKGKVDIQREIVEDAVNEQSKTSAQKLASSRTGKKRRSTKKKTKATDLNYRLKQGESYSTEDTDQEDHNQNQSTNFTFAVGKVGWVDCEGSQEEEHLTDREEISNSFSREEKHIIRQSSLRSHNDIEMVGNPPLEKPEIQSIKEDIKYKQNELAAKNSPKHKKKKSQKKHKNLRQSNEDDYADISDNEGGPQGGFGSQTSQNPNLTYGKSSAKDTEEEIEQDDEELTNSEFPPSESFTFSSENYNLKFSECSSFVLVMGNRLGNYGMSSSMETLCSVASERLPLTETSKNDEELSQKLEKVSLQDGALAPVVKCVPATAEQEKENSLREGSKSDHHNQVVVPEDENGVDSDQEFNFSVGALRFDFTPSPQLKAQKVVYKQSHDEKRFLFRSNEGGLYLKTKK